MELNQWQYMAAVNLHHGAIVTKVDVYKKYYLAKTLFIISRFIEQI